MGYIEKNESFLVLILSTRLSLLFPPCSYSFLTAFTYSNIIEMKHSLFLHGETRRNHMLLLVQYKLVFMIQKTQMYSEELNTRLSLSKSINESI